MALVRATTLDQSTCDCVFCERRRESRAARTLCRRTSAPRRRQRLKPSALASELRRYRDSRYCMYLDTAERECINTADTAE
eukprot:1799505-Prymnesium_polylepis.1